MRYAAIFLFTLGLALCVKAADPQQNPSAPQQPDSLAPANPQTEIIGQPQSPGPAQAPAPGESGYLEPAQVEGLLHKVWLSAFRIGDLLTEVHSERWRLNAAAESSFKLRLETLRAQLGVLEQWRSQFANRTDSMYLAYETSAAMGVILMRLEGVVATISEHENSSLAAQYTQAEDQLLDAQQAVQAYLRHLLFSQDQLLLASEKNLAACENTLGYAMRGSVKPATPMRNVLPDWSKRRRSQRRTVAARPARVGQPSAQKAESKAGSSPVPEAIAATSSKPEATSPAKPGQDAGKK